MALSEDFNMYYGATYIGYRRDDNKVVPFYVEGVSHNNDRLDLEGLSSREYNRVAYSDDAIDALDFSGVIENANGDNQRITIGHNDPRLIFEMPDSKYVLLRNVYHWISWRSNRSTKKGMCQRRISGAPQFNFNLAKAMFDETPAAGVIGNCLLHKGEELHYKGVIIGSWIGDEISLVPEASHLLKLVNKEIPECQTTVQTE